MTPAQKGFIDYFIQALKVYLRKWDITIEPWIIDDNDESKTIVKIPGCPLDLFILIVVSGNNPINGIWIIVNNPASCAYHFPLNSGQNIILYEYSNYKTPGNKPSPNYPHLVHIFGNIPTFREQLLAHPNPVSLVSFIDALKLIEKRIMSRYCSSKV